MEIWKDIKEYEGLYQVSNLGNVKSLRFNRVMKPHIVNTGYYMVDLYKDGARTKFYIHRLVARSFIARKNHRHQVNHINSNRLDNRVENLEWTNQSENVIHGYETGNNPRGSKRRTSKLNEDQVYQIKEMLANKEKIKDIGDKFGVSFVTISDIKRNITWKHLI